MPSLRQLSLSGPQKVSSNYKGHGDAAFRLSIHILDIVTPLVGSILRFVSTYDMEGARFVPVFQF
jgi:hypothetical protein